MDLRMLGFFAFGVTVWSVGHWYLGRRMLDTLHLSPTARARGWAMIIVVAALPVVAMTLARQFGIDWLPLSMLGFSIMGLSSMMVIFFLVADLVRLVVARLNKTPTPTASVDLADPQRRGFFANVVNMGVIGTAGSLGVVGYAQARTPPDVVEVEVPVRGLPPELDGLSIVQLSDVHVGPTIGRDYLEAVVAKANATGADLAVVTGDLIDGYVSDLSDQVAPLGELKGRYGTYFVTGNHEYYWNGLQWCEYIASLGLTVLTNEHRIIEHRGARIMVAGVTDYSAGRHVKEHVSDPAKACADAAPCDFRVLLAHQPRSVFAASEAGYDLVLSGHTHGGQYFPMNILVYLAQPYVAGLYRHEKSWIYVSRGTGYWGPPMRLGAPHEITLLRLVAAE